MHYQLSNSSSCYGRSGFIWLVVLLGWSHHQLSPFYVVLDSTPHPLLCLQTLLTGALVHSGCTHHSGSERLWEVFGQGRHRQGENKEADLSSSAVQSSHQEFTPPRFGRCACVTVYCTVYVYLSVFNTVYC